MVSEKLYDEIVRVTEAFFGGLDCSICANNGNSAVCEYCSNHGGHNYLLFRVGSVHAHSFTEEVLRIVREHEENNI